MGHSSSLPTEPVDPHDLCRAEYALVYAVHQYPPLAMPGFHPTVTPWSRRLTETPGNAVCGSPTGSVSVHAGSAHRAVFSPWGL